MTDGVRVPPHGVYRRQTLVRPRRSDVLLVSYGAMVSDSRAEMIRICDFLDLAYRPELDEHVDARAELDNRRVAGRRRSETARGACGRRRRASTARGGRPNLGDFNGRQSTSLAQVASKRNSAS